MDVKSKYCERQIQKPQLEALVQLVTVRNLPYNCSQWPELHTLLMAVNYIVEGVISLSHGSQSIVIFIAIVILLI